MREPDSCLDDVDPDDLVEQILRSGLKSAAALPQPYAREHRHLTPVFAFDHVQMNGSAFCFNNPAVTPVEWVALMQKCQELSALTFPKLLDADFSDGHRFHEVSLGKLRAHGLDKHLEQVCRASARNAKIELPTVWQFALYTNAAGAPRVLGYVGKWAVFYLLWFDVGHLIYPEK